MTRRPTVLRLFYRYTACYVRLPSGHRRIPLLPLHTTLTQAAPTLLAGMVNEELSEETGARILTYCW